MILGIYGASGLGREVLILAEQINEIEKRWKEIIFIDDTGTITNLMRHKVIPFKDAEVQYTNTDIEFIIAVGEPQSRRILRERIYNAGFSLTILVHPSVKITEWTEIKEGTIICCNCFVSCNVKIDENVLLQPFSSVGHDSQIENDTVISSYVSISGGCIIGRETYIGVHVPIKEDVSIGSQSIVGMGSVVIRNIPDQVIAMGNPARPMKNNVDYQVFHKKQ